FAALKSGDTSAAGLADYDRRVEESLIRRDLYARRDMRLVFQKAGFYLGGIEAGLMSLTGGALPGGRIASEPDADVPRVVTPAAPLPSDGGLTVRKLDAVFKSGNATRDDIPSHLVMGGGAVPPEVAEFYAHMCPAGVYERQGDRLAEHVGGRLARAAA